MIAITPEQLAERRRQPKHAPAPIDIRFIKPCKHCGSADKPKAPGVNVCRDCRNEQKRRNRAAHGKITIIGG